MSELSLKLENNEVAEILKVALMQNMPTRNYIPKGYKIANVIPGTQCFFIYLVPETEKKGEVMT